MRWRRDAWPRWCETQRRERPLAKSHRIASPWEEKRGRATKRCKDSVKEDTKLRGAEGGRHEILGQVTTTRTFQADPVKKHGYKSLIHSFPSITAAICQFNFFNNKPVSLEPFMK